MSNEQLKKSYADPEECARDILEIAGPHIKLALPLGLGKANLLANALYHQVASHPSLKLDIFTALTLERPSPTNDIEARFMGPVTDRLFGSYADLAFAAADRSSSLPDNIRVFQFYFQPGKRLGSDPAQQRHISSNYTHIVRDLLDRGVNVFAQLVAPLEKEDGFNLSCNADLTQELLDHRDDPDRGFIFIGEANTNLPVMDRGANLPRSDFDVLLEPPKPHFDIVKVPNREVGLADYAAGLHASSLVADGGTIQFGIGSLSDAAAHVLR
ncbi:MAG: acetyl-CoA hydrolase, partial [Alphaproteobacteria bacterium]|nr:acetyl-CoA hydrolase [Alphaproteobacteria bacterium]